MIVKCRSENVKVKLPHSILFYISMCITAFIYNKLSEYPILIAANRDESYSRVAATPLVWGKKTKFLAPKDVKRGGTWIGCNGTNFAVALNNRYTNKPENPQCRSRGLLAAELLQQLSATRAGKLLQMSVKKYEYNPFNVLCLFSDHSFVAYYEGVSLTFQPITSGVHAITDSQLDTHDSPRVRQAVTGIHEILHKASSPANRHVSERINFIINSLQKLCAWHDRENTDGSICLHGKRAGTVSSTIIALGAQGHKGRFFHADGPPCCTPYEDFSDLMDEL